MGSPESEADRRSDERQHPVTLSKGFWLADTTCTQALWVAVMGYNNSSFQDNSDNPVENISLGEINRFFTYLNNLMPNITANLPTEAEWEYACRAGTTTAYSSMEDICLGKINCYNRHNTREEKTVPVKSFPPNPWGLYEMHGNVWEYCIDTYDRFIKGSEIDPCILYDSAYRVIRGGSWNNSLGHCRSASRNDTLGISNSSTTGFRIKLYHDSNLS